MYNTHHCTLYERVGWSSLAVRRTRHWHQFIFKVIDGKLPPYLTRMLNWKQSTYQTRSCDWLKLDPPSVQSEQGKSAFCFDASDSWNILQLTLKNNAPISYGTFNNFALESPY